MLATLLVWGAFILVMVIAPVRPWIGVAGYYGFVLSMPKWNWSWAAPPSFAFEMYIVVATLIGLLLNANWQILRYTPVRFALVALTGFILLGYISLENSIDAERSAKAFDTMWKICAMALISVFALTTQNQIRWVMWVATLAQSYNAYAITMDYLAVGMCEYVNSGWGLGIGSNQAAIIALCALSLSFGLLVTEQLWTLRLVALLCIMFQAHEIMLLESRGSMLGAVILVMGAFVLVPKTKHSHAALAISIAGASVLAGPSVVREFSSSFQTGEAMDSSAASRFDIWSAGLKAIGERPLLGAGPGASGILVAKYYEREVRTNKNAHNQPIAVAADYGIPAFVLYYCFFGCCFVAALRVWREYPTGRSAPGVYACMAGLMGASFASLTSSGLLVEPYYLLGMLGLTTLNLPANPVRDADIDDDDLLERLP